MSERASAAYRAQKEFVGDVSHELRTPVTSILGFSQALLDGTADDDESRERFARIVHAEAERLLELTTTLLALADLDSGRVELAREAVSTTRLFEALEARHSAAATSRGVSLDLEDSSAGVAPLADEARVLQVATALISNALAHTPERGRLRVSARGEGDHWCFAVDDSGAGVAAEDHARIFERFVRLDRSRSQQTGGSGLGLAICSRLVTMMDGTIGVTDSDLGGARFYVCLPRADSPGELNTNSTPAQLADNADGR
jgi:signal transduction histidine kinase